jgi:hypothetical protein
LSIFHAACSTIRRAALISARDSAMKSWIVWRVASGLPGPMRRVVARWHMSSKERSQMPIHRMQ